LPSPSTHWGWFPHFHQWFSSWDGGYFILGGICLCLDSFTTSFFWRPLEYGVWIFMKLFCPKWFCEWYQLIFQGMCAHCLRSCSTFSIEFTFSILTFRIREA
jgi:hypothetical protein